jgi:hypothetical protein
MHEQTYIQRLSDRAHGRAPLALDAIEDGAAEAPGAAQPIIGRYRLGTRLGRGRLGEIFEALDLADRDLGVERRKAVQLLAPRAVSDPGFAERLARAFEALRTAGHPNLASIFDVGRDGQRHYLVMELLAGASVRTVLADAGVLPLEEALPVIGAVGNALAYLHAKGVVHGNVRPEQVFVTFDYEVKLLDVVPLPLREAPAEVGDDVFGLACLAYTLLAGRHPFNECSAREAQRAGLRLAPIATLPATKWAALERGLALSPGDRPASVMELMAELGLEGGERLCAGPESGAGPELGARTESRPGPEFRAAPEPARPEPAPLPVVWPEYVPQNPLRVRATSQHAQRPILLLVAAAVLGGATFLEHERLRDATADLFALAAPRVEDGWTRLRPPAPSAEREIVAGTFPSEAPGGLPVATSIVESAPAVVAHEPEPPKGADPANLEVDPVAQSGVAAESAVPHAVPATEELEQTVPVAAPASAGEIEASFDFAAPVVTVAESAAAARVVLERSGDASSRETVVWWTTDGTAVADEDYADLGERTETLGPGELERTLFVPLIQDTVPESVEQFTVHVGRYDQSRRNLALVSSVRVEIRGD